MLLSEAIDQFLKVETHAKISNENINLHHFQFYMVVRQKKFMILTLS